jgi:Ca2+/Na+ antiporter
MEKTSTRAEKLVYREQVSSKKTQILFTALTTLFLFLLIWRLNVSGLDIIAAGFTFLFAIFLFYSLNYTTLIIRLTPKALKLKFGIISWTVPVDNIADCRLDQIPSLMRKGGAGIHFMFIHKRYRASFNFLEHPRVVIAFKRKVGPVQDISFSTRHPEDVIHHIQEVISGKKEQTPQDID